MSIALRPVRADDEAFLLQVYAGTREDVAAAPLTPEQRRAFLQVQFRAQQLHYSQYCPDARHEIILIDDRPAGRLYVDRRAGEIRIMDIALRPEHRGAGTGSKILHDLLAEAGHNQQRVTIHVETGNRSMRLFQRLGFVHVSDNGVYSLMEWRPEPAG